MSKMSTRKSHMMFVPSAYKDVLFFPLATMYRDTWHLVRKYDTYSAKRHSKCIRSHVNFVLNLSSNELVDSNFVSLSLSCEYAIRIDLSVNVIYFLTFRQCFCDCVVEQVPVTCSSMAKFIRRGKLCTSLSHCSTIPCDTV